MAVATRLCQASDGRTLAVCEWGPPDGSPVFFLHGTPGGRLLRHVNGEYERHGLRVITYDRPGYGRSTRRRGRTVGDGAADVIAIADQLGLETFGVVGLSGGGPHALAVAAACPDRVHRCATIVSGAPPGAIVSEDPEKEEHWHRLDTEGEPYLLRQLDAFRDWIPQFAAEPAKGPALRTQTMMLEEVHDALAAGPYGYVDDHIALRGPWDFNAADVAAPTQIMLARDDAIPAAEGDWLTRTIPGAELIWVDGGHLGPRDTAEEQLLAWAGGTGP